MTFQPAAKAKIKVEGTEYTIAEHPTAPGLPYGQQGRAGTVYQLLSSSSTKALKVFKPRFSTPSLVMQANAIRPFANLPGLQVCKLSVLSPSSEGSLLRQYPDLTYALLMPWIDGQTWYDVINSHLPFTTNDALAFAKKLASILVGLEEHCLAHCDLSSSNIILAKNLDDFSIELIDIDGMYGSNFPLPKTTLSGSPGYAHNSILGGSWNNESDRFAGAVLLAEILGWSSPDIRQAATDGCLFTAKDIQKDCPLYHLLVKYLRCTFGEPIADNFSAAWHSETLSDCPTFGKWLVSIPEEVKATSNPIKVPQTGEEEKQTKTASDTHTPKEQNKGERPVEVQYDYEIVENEPKINAPKVNLNHEMNYPVIDLSDNQKPQQINEGLINLTNQPNIDSKIKNGSQGKDLFIVIGFLLLIAGIIFLFINLNLL